MKFTSWLMLFCVMFLEITITQLPLTLVFLLCLTVMKRGEWIFFIAFAAGIFLDIFSLRYVGQTSVFFLLFIFLVLLYEKKYEIATLPFVALTSFLGSFFYLLFIQAGPKISYAISCFFLGGVAFLYLSAKRKKQQEGGYRKV